nr:g2-specific protein kinase nim-1 [Quercus suber]
MPEHEDGDRYDVLEKIGQGSFGIIRKVRLRSTGQILCRKEISYSRMSAKEKEQLYSELKILESLRHPSIVQYYHREHIKSCNDLHLYMEYCGNGDLGGYIKKLRDKGQWADEEFVWSIFAQLVGALYRCHYGEDPPVPGQEGTVKKGKAFQTKEGYRVVLHRDLKPENGEL